jgi:hypothetical protein
MATPAQLVQTISSATGVPLATVVDIDRKLVKAKLRNKTGRGFNAARMAPLDAARLLTAVLGSPYANTAAEAVRRYARTRPDEQRSSERLFAAAKLDDLATLPVRHGFVEALAAVISSAATGSLAKLIATSDRHSEPSIEVFAFTQATRGRIRIAGLPNGLTAHVEYVPVATTKIQDSRRVPARGEAGDLEQSRRITDRTILPVARLLRGESS